MARKQKTVAVEVIEEVPVADIEAASLDEAMSTPVQDLPTVIWQFVNRELGESRFGSMSQYIDEEWKLEGFVPVNIPDYR
jgi:hypothetical protein